MAISLDAVFMSPIRMGDQHGPRDTAGQNSTYAHSVGAHRAEPFDRIPEDAGGYRSPEIEA